MESIDLGQQFIDDFRENDHIGVSEQMSTFEPAVEPGRVQCRTYFDFEHNMYDVHPCLARDKECDAVLSWFAEKYPGNVVYHITRRDCGFLGRQLFIYYLPNHDYRTDKYDTDADVYDCWNELFETAAETDRLPTYCRSLVSGHKHDDEFGETTFCATDNGCIMCL